jgi:hypothetical protein
MDDRPEEKPSKSMVRGAFGTIWRAIANSFVAVLVAAAVLFFLRQRLRMAEIQDHYARTAAKLGQQVELVYESYQRVIDVAVQNGALVSAIAPSAGSAMKTKYAADDVHRKDAEQRLREAERLKTVAEDLRKANAVSQYASGAELEVASDVANEANAKATLAMDEARRKAEALTNASEAAKKAEEALKEAQQKAVRPTTLDASVPDAGAAIFDPAVAAAEKRFKTADQVVADRRKEADASARNADTERSKARKANEDLQIAADKLRKTLDEARRAQVGQQAADEAVARQRAALQLTKERPAAQSTADLSDDQKAVAAAKGILPSYANAACERGGFERRARQQIRTASTCCVR